MKITIKDLFALKGSLDAEAIKMLEQQDRGIKTPGYGKNFLLRSDVDRIFDECELEVEVPQSVAEFFEAQQKKKKFNTSLEFLRGMSQ